MYINKNPSLFKLFRIYKHKWTEEFDNELQDLIAGIKRIASKAKQEGLGSLEEGKQELSFDLYKKNQSLVH
jgi:flagellar motor component MotA